MIHKKYLLSSSSSLLLNRRLSGFFFFQLHPYTQRKFRQWPNVLLILSLFLFRKNLIKSDFSDQVPRETFHTHLTRVSYGRRQKSATIGDLDQSERASEMEKEWKVKLSRAAL